MLEHNYDYKKDSLNRSEQPKKNKNFEDVSDLPDHKKFSVSEMLHGIEDPDEGLMEGNECLSL